MLRFTFALLSTIALIGCSKDNPDYCAFGANSAGNGCVDAPAGTGSACTTSSGCTDPLPVCDTSLGGGTCVMCTMGSHDLCVGKAPRCEANFCVACVDDSDCGGTAGVCMMDGSCADPTHIIYASAGGSADMSCGTTATPCSLDEALDLASKSTTKNIIKLTDAGPYVSTMPSFMVGVDVGKNLVLDARGAMLHHNMKGPILHVMDGKGVTIIGGTIELASSNGNNGDGIGIKGDGSCAVTIYKTEISQNDATGVDVPGTLTMIGANIHDNGKASSSPGVNVAGGTITSSQSLFSGNSGGGIIVGNGEKFTIVGNAFNKNGNSTSNVGGFSAQTATTANRLDFNTFANNQTSTGLTSGVACTNSGLIAQNNIIWDNTPAGSPVSGNCVFDYSDIGPTGITGAQNGPHNLSPTDPQFVSLTDLSLMASSLIQGKANPGADLTGLAAKDINSKPRMAPADPGAYVVPAQ